MKNLLIAFLLFVPALAQAQEAEVGLYYQRISGAGTPTSRVFVEGYSYFRGVETAGAWGFIYTEKEYFSAVGGLFSDLISFGPDMVLEFGVGAGVESFDGTSYTRFGSFVLVGNEKLFSEWYLENGTSGENWLRVNSLWQATKRVAVGVFHQTGDGTGPRILFSVPKTPLRIWVGPMFGEERKLLIGGEFLFKK